MTRKNYKTLYYRFDSMVPVAAIRGTDLTNYDTPVEPNSNNLFEYSTLVSQILKDMQSRGLLPVTLSTDEYVKEIFREIGGWYVPFNTRRIQVYDSATNTGTSASDYGVSLEYTTRLVLADGVPIKKTQQVYGGRTGAPVRMSRTYVYSDWVDIMQKTTTLLAHTLEKAKQLVSAYNAIPVVNEQLTDNTTVTPNLISTHKENFDPIGSISAADKIITTNQQTGSHTSISKRARDVSAAAQAEIVRRLPNLFMEFINQIKTILIDPRTIQDMCDWGLDYGVYVAGEVL